MNTRINLVQGDITSMRVDAIVNAANSSLMGGGGVDGAIHRAGGPSILEECKKIIERIGKCETGNSVITSAGNLPANFVIHTVGPVWKGGNAGEAFKLSQCYVSALKLATARNLRTIAFPNISTGIYGYPKLAAADVAISAVIGYLETDSIIEKIHFVCFDSENFQHYQSLLRVN